MHLISVLIELSLYFPVLSNKRAGTARLADSFFCIYNKKSLRNAMKAKSRFSETDREETAKTETVSWKEED